MLLSCWCTEGISGSDGAIEALGLKPTLGIDGGHTAAASRRDRLAIHSVHDVASRKHAIDAGQGGTGFGDNIALCVKVKLSTKQGGIWDMSNGQKHGGCWYLACFIAFNMTDFDGMHSASCSGFPDNVLDHSVP